VGSFIAAAALSATIADARQMRRDFGVTSAEAARRQALIAAGDPRLGPEDAIEYNPSGGLHHGDGSVTLVYLASPRWALLTFGELAVLGDAALDSPLVRERTTLAGGFGMIWHL
jgi:outer membrane scaffolding protein for murein synthesis (MipA/OmpV family)